MAMEFAGDENTNEKTRFRFWCADTETAKATSTFTLSGQTHLSLSRILVDCPYEGGPRLLSLGCRQSGDYAC